MQLHLSTDVNSLFADACADDIQPSLVLLVRALMIPSAVRIYSGQEVKYPLLECEPFDQARRIGFIVTDSVFQVDTTRSAWRNLDRRVFPTNLPKPGSNISTRISRKVTSGTLLERGSSGSSATASGRSGSIFPMPTLASIPQRIPVLRAPFLES